MNVRSFGMIRMAILQINRWIIHRFLRCGMIRVIPDPGHPKRTDSFDIRYCGTLNRPLLFNRQAVPCRSCEINLKIK